MKAGRFKSASLAFSSILHLVLISSSPSPSCTLDKRNLHFGLYGYLSTKSISYVIVDREKIIANSDRTNWLRDLLPSTKS